MYPQQWRGCENECVCGYLLFFFSSKNAPHTCNLFSFKRRKKPLEKLQARFDGLDLFARVLLLFTETIQVVKSKALFTERVFIGFQGI